MTDLYQCFCQEMERLGLVETEPFFAVAVSGGVDSIVLSHLLSRFCRSVSGRLIGFTIDHQLRPSSGAEASWVQQQFKEWGADHQIFYWQASAEDKKSMQKNARLARYQMMHEYLQKCGGPTLFLAHHQDDQIETYLLRRQKKSGQAGLACMASVTDYSPSLKLVRPLLKFSKQQLIAYAEQQKLSWCEDESNLSDNYLRNSLRLHDIPKLSAVERDKILQEIATYQQKRLQYDVDFQKFYKEFITSERQDIAQFEKQNLLSKAGENQLWILRRLCQLISGSSYLPAEGKVEKLLAELASENFTGKTLGGVAFYQRQGKLCLVRENRNIPEIYLSPQKLTLWDGRYYFKSSVKTEKVQIVPLAKVISSVPEDFETSIKRNWGRKAFFAWPVVIIGEMPHIIEGDLLRHGGRTCLGPVGEVEIYPALTVGKNLYPC